MLPSLLLLCKPRQLVVQLKVWFNPSRIISDKGLGGLPLLGWQHHANYRAEPSLSLTSFPQKIASSSPGRLGAWLLNNDDSTGWVETIKSMSAPQAASPGSYGSTPEQHKPQTHSSSAVDMQCAQEWSEQV